MKSLIPVAAIGLGILLLVGSALWTVLFTTTSSWTDEKSQQMTELTVKAQKRHYALEMARRKPSMTSGKNPAILKEKYDEVMKELDALRDEFNSANDAPKTMSSILKWSGISVLGIGIFGWMATKGA